MTFSLLFPRILLGFDARGQSRELAIIGALRESGATWETVPGSGSRAYPEIAFAAGERMQADVDIHSAILVCGSGIGMSIAANKVPGVRAARCTDAESVEVARRNAGANVLTTGSDFVDDRVARELVARWLAHEFDSDRSRPKVATIMDYDRTRLD